MNTMKTTAGDHSWPRNQMIEYATLTPEDKAQIVQCRGTHNRLGFAYQIAFARLMFWISTFLGVIHTSSTQCPRPLQKLSQRHRKNSHAVRRTFRLLDIRKHDFPS